MSRRLSSLIILGALCVLSFSAPATAAIIGVMGDSLSDEYSEGDLGAIGQNWVTQLATYRGVDFGPTAAAAGKANWGDVRGKGYEYNWALYGADSYDLISDGQHTGLAAQKVSKGVQYGIVMIGANDLIYSGSNYANIYNNAWTPAQIATFKTGVVNNIITAYQTAAAAGIKMVLADVPDYNVTPAAVSNRPDVAGRNRVSAVVTDINQQLKQYAALAHASVLDLQAFATAIFGTNNALKTTLKIGNVNINLRQSTFFGTPATAAFLDDRIHISTPIQGVLANMVVTAFNDSYHANITPFTEAEILQHRSIAYGGSDTLNGQLGSLSNYVILNNVPEPGTLPLAGIAMVMLVTLGVARRRANAA